MEWITRPGHRPAVLIVGTAYALIAAGSLRLLRRRPQQAVTIALGTVSALAAAMLGYSPLVRGSGELCVLALNVLLGGFAVAFPLGLRHQLIASIVPLAGYALVLQLGTHTAYPVWYSALALVSFLTVLAFGAHAIDRYRKRILADAFRQRALAEENARLRDVARAADQAKTDLLSMLSHELRTPLSNIRMFAEILGDGLYSDQDQLVSYLRRISDQSKRAADIVHTMLAFGSIETGTLRLTLEEFELAELLDGLRVEIPSAWRRPTVELKWPTAGDKQILMLSDRGKVEGIVRNLIHNALKHTRDGSVTIEISEHPERDAIRIAVADTGEGIAPEQLSRIFDRFARATTGGAGFGLGLFIVKRFADVLDGEVRVESTPASGSRFEVVLPRVVRSEDDSSTSRAA
ncbi:MAG TPA: HAMP domain-containing sensor histidine kinase [Terriglobales bacterium]|nr:HAMP domain-containing sensor histidine kinase [Terriglobales bacterium]